MRKGAQSKIYRYFLFRMQGDNDSYAGESSTASDQNSQSEAASPPLIVTWAERRKVNLRYNSNQFPS